MRCARAVVCVAASIAVLGCGQDQLRTTHAAFHTSPELWSGPRVFHRPFETSYEDRIQVSRVPLVRAASDRVLSSNGAYWFARQEPDTQHPGPWHTVVDVFNERDELVRIKIEDHCSHDVETSWINEKLVYIEVWWGRVLGTSMVYDVEAERFLFKEMMHAGSIPFQQYREARISATETK